VTCLERGIDPLEYVLECRDVVHMDNLLVYLKDSTIIGLILKAGMGVRLDSWTIGIETDGFLAGWGLL